MQALCGCLLGVREIVLTIVSAVTDFPVEALHTTVAVLAFDYWLPGYLHSASITPERITIAYHLTPPYSGWL
jgi:uncharacterized membrane protein